MDTPKIICITSPQQLKVGDFFQFTCSGRGRGNHCTAYAKVTKVNRKTVDALEQPRSYRPGTPWRVTINESMPAWIYPGDQKRNAEFHGETHVA